MKYFILSVLVISSLLISNNSEAQCDATLWSHVYHSYRLVVNKQCDTVTGIVAAIWGEADGDMHIRLNVDSRFSFMINAANVSGEAGCLVCEPICATTCTQSDAISSCAGFTNTVFLPAAGERVYVVGSYVTDNVHGWNEIHPVTAIGFTTAIENIEPNKPFVNIYPNPASSYVYVKLSDKPTKPVHIVISDGLGRLAGQYQMFDTQVIKIPTDFLPEATYYYHISQDDILLKGGSFVVIHNK